MAFNEIVNLAVGKGLIEEVGEFLHLKWQGE